MLVNVVYVTIFNSGSNSVRPPISPSVTRILCDKTKQCTADILIPHERAITLVF